MTIRAGILSDTHLTIPDQRFIRLAEQCFKSCKIIIHAGDLTNLGILNAFKGKKIYAVHGNMCSHQTCMTLSWQQTFQIADFTFGLTHGARLGYDIESALSDLFPEADCMIYGHTHQPVCHRQGGVLIINPGSFRATSRHGAPGTYSILEIGQNLKASIHEVPPLP